MSSPQTVYAQPYEYKPKEGSCAMAVIGVIVAIIVVVAVIVIVVQNVNREAQLKQIEENTKKAAAMRAARMAQESAQRQHHAVRMGQQLHQQQAADMQRQHQAVDMQRQQHAAEMQRRVRMSQAQAMHTQQQMDATNAAQQMAAAQREHMHQQQLGAQREHMHQQQLEAAQREHMHQQQLEGAQREHMHQQQLAAAQREHMQKPQRMQLKVAAGPRLLTAEEAATLPAPFPSTQLNTPNTFENTVETDLAHMPTAMGGIAPGNAMGTHQSQTSESPFSDVAYQQDPASMTPQSAADMTGLNAYLPNEAGATEDGRDPQTGLPIFTPNKLRRSNMLGSYGKEGFLRQVQDPLTGYRKSVGKWYCSSNQLTNDLNVRRRQFNAERASGNDDPVLFNSSDWAYF